MKNALHIDSEIVFLDSDKIQQTIAIETDGVKYESLFSLYYLQEMVEEYDNLKGNKLSDIEIAERILEYRINDA